MAGFLRKKSKQEPQPKATPIHHGTAPSDMPTPLFARFASSSTTQSQQEQQRIVSSPMLLSSGTRKGGPVPQNRGERIVAGNSANGVRGDVRDVEARAQRTQPYMMDRSQERPRNTTIEARPQQHQPLAAQPKPRPVSRVPMLDKPLPLPTPQPDMYNPQVYASNSAGTYHPPPQLPLHTQEFAGEQSWATPLQQQNKPLPQPINTPPTMTPLNSRPTQRKSMQGSDIATLKHNRPYSVTSPSNPLPNPPPGRPLPAQDSHSQPIHPSRVPKSQPSLPPTHVYEAQFDPDHPSHSQTLTPHASNRDWQPVENGLRSDSGAAPGHTTPPHDAMISQQYNELLQVVFGEQSANGNQRQSYHSPVLSDNPLPDPASFQQEFDSAPLPSPSSSPNTQRKFSKLNAKGQPHTRSSAAYIDNPVVAAPHPLPAKPDNRRSYQPPPENMGVNISSLDVSALPSSYKNVVSNGSFLQHRAPLPPVNNHASPQQRTPKQTGIPPRTSASMRSVNPPPMPGKPLIFAAMAAIDQEDARTPDRQSVVIEPVSNFPPPPPPHHPPPAEFSFPSKPAPPPSQFPTQNGQPRNPNANPARTELHPLPTPPNQHTTAPQRPSFPQPSSSPPKSEVRTPHMGGPRPLPHSAEQPGVRQSPSRTRKLSKARNPAQESSDFSVHSHSSSVSGVHHRSPGKPRPATPLSQGVTKVSPPVIEDDGVGVPLDDDPFAMVEGVKLLKPTSRAGSPEKEGTVKQHRSKGQLSRERTSEDFHSASDGEALQPAQGAHAPTEASNDNTARPRTSEGRKVAPPIASVIDQKDRLTAYLADPHLLSALLGFLSFYDWCMVLSLSREIRFALVQGPQLRETVLERFLQTVGYARWAWDDPDPISLSLQDLGDYMRGVSTPTHEYSRVADLYVHSLSIHPSHRDPALYDTVHQLAAATRAYTRVVLRLRAQAEKEASVARARGGGRAGSRPPSRAPSPTMSSTFSHSNHSYSSPPPAHRAAAAATPTSVASASGAGAVFSSPLFRLRRAPLLRVFVPSPDGDWLSDKSVLECEAECRRAGVAHLMRVGDVVWDVAVGDEGNVGRLVWDGSYLLDLDYTYTAIGDLPKYMPTLAFPPSYFHRVIRTGASSSNPIVHVDLRPWGEEIAMNLQLLQDRVRTETPQGAYHNVVRWVHRSSFVIRPPPRGAVRPYSSGRVGAIGGGGGAGRIPIPESNGLYVDAGWYGTIVVETEGTNEALADLQERCGPGAFPPRARGVNGQGTAMERESRKVFRILREKSRPGEIWIRTVSVKERLL